MRAVNPTTVSAAPSTRWASCSARARRSARRNDDGLAIRLELDLEAASAGKQPGIEWLDRVRVDGPVLRGPFQQGGDGFWDARIGTGCHQSKPDILAFSYWAYLDGAAARDCLAGDNEHVQEQLDPIFRQQGGRQLPDKLGFAILDKPPRHVMGIAEVDLRAGRARRSESQSAELQAR